MADFLDSVLGNNKQKSFGPDQGSSWNLIRGVFTRKDDPSKSVVFFTESNTDTDRLSQNAIDQFSDAGGRRLAIYEYPYQDGQKVKDLGARGETHSFSVKFFGDNYQSKFDEFMRVVNTRGAGILSHPTLSPIRGSITVRFREYEIQHRHDEWNAVTIRVTFVDDNTDELSQKPKVLSVSSQLNKSVQELVDAQSTIAALISSVGQALSLPSQVLSSLQSRVTQVANIKAKLLGQLASTYNARNAFTALLSDAQGLVGGLFAVSSGVSASSAGSVAVGTALPPTFQVGYDPVTQAAVDANTAAFVASNQITPQQAVFQANQVRSSINTAINEITLLMGNDGADIVQQYRAMAISAQEATEAAIAAAQSKVKMYTVPFPMSLRQVAYENGLSPDRGNDIENLNPYLPSVNYIPRGSVLSIPVA